MKKILGIAGFLFLFLIFSSLAQEAPRVSVVTTYAEEGNVTLNVYSEYHYPPEFMVVKVDDKIIDRFPTTETYHSYSIKLESGYHEIKVLWDGPTWYGVAFTQKILVREKPSYATQSWVEDKISKIKDTWRPLYQIWDYLISRILDLYNALKPLILKDFATKLEIKMLEERIYALERAIQIVSKEAYIKGRIDACIEFNCSSFKVGKTIYYRTEKGFIGITPL